MRDFWAQQDAARWASRWLAGLLLVAVVAVVAAVDGLTWWLCNLGHLAPEDRSTLVAIATVTTLVLILGGAAWRFWQLRGGGSAVAHYLGGREVVRTGADEAQRRLLDVVEEMAIASGLPVPSVYVLEEQGINACAAGYRAEDAVLCVTRGALNHLTRDELQGVMAHEFSHILNGDMGLNLRTLCLVHGLLVISLTGRLMIEVSLDGHSRHPVGLRRDRRGDLALLGFGVALGVLGFIGWCAGLAIRAAVCRQRELLADAHAVQFTRHPAGLAGALVKTLGLSRGSLIVNPAAAEAAHLFFAKPRRDWWEFGLDTHPPVQERIRLLDPAWDGRVPDLVSWRPARDEPALRPQVGPAPTPMPAAARVGTFSPEAVAFGAQLLALLPITLRTAVGEASTAQAAALAALLPADHAAWGTLSDRRLAEQGRILARHLDTAGRAAGRLTLLHLCLPALRRLSPSQSTTLAGHIEAITSPEFAGAVLAQVLLLRLRPPEASPTIFHAMTPLIEDCRVLLSALSTAGRGDTPTAFRAAWPLLLVPGAIPDLAPTDLTAVTTALGRLRRSNGAIKRRLVAACAQAVAADGQVDPAEAELLRLVCDGLGCPLPAFGGPR